VAPAELVLCEGQGIPGGCGDDFTVTLSPVPSWHFESSGAHAQLTGHFGTDSLAGFDIQDMPAAICAAGALLRYVARTQSGSLAHIQQITADRASQYVLLDPATRRNLELTQTLRGEDSPTLFSTVDHCGTPMGSRLLRHWLHHPLRDNGPVLARQRAIATLLRAGLGSLQDALAPLPDIERMAARMALRSIRPRELASLRDAVASSPRLRQTLDAVTALDCLGDEPASQRCTNNASDAERLRALAENLHLDPALADLLARAIAPEPAVAVRDGGVMAPGYDPELDELRQLQSHSGD